MYKIIKDADQIVQDSIDNVVIDPELKEHLNGVSSLTYSIPFNDQYYDDYIELKTKVTIFDQNKNNPEFSGRLLSKNKTFDGNIKLTFEGELAFLNDIQFPPYDFKGTPEELFENVLNYYNSKCSKDKKILKGIVTVQDDNNYIARSNQDYSSCWSVINDKLIKLLGGYIKLRYVNGVRYLDYLINSGNVANQNIEFGKNLLDLENYIDATSVSTVIIPLGAKNESGERITIESVNENKNYLESSLISIYGRIEKTVIWDDVTVPSNLKTKALKELNQMILSDRKITVKAIDLHFTSEEIHSFRIGDTISCISAPHDINIKMMLVERMRKLNDPSQDEITLGTESKRFTSTVNDVNKKVEETESKITGNWLQSVIEENTKTLLGGSGGYIYVHYADENKKHPDALYIMDSELVGEANNVILVNENGIGFSNNGINGPFVSAWTIDGKFNTDFIQANTINVNHLASNVGEKLDLSSNESIKLLVKDIQTKIENLTPISTETMYQIGDSGTEPPSGTWFITYPEPVQGKYLWTRKIVTYESGLKNTSYDISYYAEDGKDGKSVTVTETKVEYATSSNITTIPQSWSETRPTTIPQGHYLWTKTTVKYSDGKSTVVYAWNYQGVDGTSIEISSQTSEYQSSESGIEIPTGTWSDEIIEVPQGQYLWTKNTITYSNGLVTTSYSVAYHGLDGDDGTIRSDTAPTDTSKMWFDTTDNLLKYWDGETWEVANDFAEDINNVRTEITTEYNSAIDQLKNSITSLVEELQTTTTDNSQAVNRLASQIEQNATSISQIITETNSIVDNISGLATKEEISKWARFYGEGANAILELGASNSPFAVKLSNTELGFYQNGTRIAYLSNQMLNISQAVVMTKLKFTHYEWNDVEIDNYYHLILK